MKARRISHENRELSREPDVAELRRVGTLDDADAEAEYKKLANRGSVMSMVNLGHLYEYRNQKDGGPNFMESEFWYRRAVDSGSAVATLHCGYFYLRRNSYEKAREIFLLGFNRGYAPSTVRLANLYLKGLGVERDYKYAKTLLQCASEMGNLWAKLAVANMTVTLGSNVFEKSIGLFMVCMAALHIRMEEWRHPKSERIKK